MEKRSIAWITFNAFLDTDLYVVKELASYYKIDWYILRSENDKFEYIDMLEEMDSIEDLSIQLCVCGERLRKLKCISYYKKMLSKIKCNNPDLIFTSMAGAPYFIPTLSASVKTNKTVMAIHNVHVPKGGTSYYFFKFYNKLTIRRFKHFLTYSKSQYEAMKSIAPKKDVNYAPFILKDYGEPTRERESETITFLNFGNIRAYKRIDVLIEAAQKAYEITNIKFKVIIAGMCDNWDEYQNHIKYDFLFDLRIARVENNEVANLFNECDYFVAPYQDIAQSGSSVVAINYCKPIIASRLPAFEEYIVDGETGYLIKPADEESLVDVFVKILRDDKSSYKQMVKSLIDNREENFSSERIIEKYRELFENVINE